MLDPDKPLEAISVTALLADDMLSRAICVTGAAFRGHVLLYQRPVLSLCVLLLSFWSLLVDAGSGGTSAGKGTWVGGMSGSVLLFVVLDFAVLFFFPTGAMKRLHKYAERNASSIKD